MSPPAAEAAPGIGPRYDCVVAGSCVMDVVCRPVALDRAVGRGTLRRVDPIVPIAGGIVSNAGIALARLGLRAAGLSRVGRDAWGRLLLEQLSGQGLDTSRIERVAGAPSGAAVVLVDPGGERSFLASHGPTKALGLADYLDHLDVLGASGFVLLGYYSRMPALEPDLPELLARVRAAGGRTAMDTAGDGGSMEPLAEALPHLDLYVPSEAEARGQTGESDPEAMIRAYRRRGAAGVVGVKLGARGALLCDPQGERVMIDPVPPGGPVVDTTGAGDCFMAGLIAGLVRGLPLDAAGRLGAAAASMSITKLGGWAGVGTLDQAAELAGIALPASA